MFLDAVGKACPMPVVMAKKELDAGCGDLTVAVDNAVAVENLKRLAAEKGLRLSVEEKAGVFHVRIGGTGEAAASSAPAVAAAPAAEPRCAPQGCGYAVFIGRDHVGDGAEELGQNLMKMAIYTLSQSDDVPAYLLFMNGGVKLPAGGEQQVIDGLNALIGKGCEVLVCGACLNYYGLADKLKVGAVSNMYDILGRMQRAAKVITL